MPVRNPDALAKANLNFHEQEGNCLTMGSARTGAVYVAAGGGHDSGESEWRGGAGLASMAKLHVAKPKAAKFLYE